MSHHFIRPVDVLYLRGNRLFGAAGDHAAVEMPPWPSVFAGAIRSRILVDRGVDLARFAKKGELDDEEVRRSLGVPGRPGTFRITEVLLARRQRGGEVEPLFPLPADLLVFDADGEGEARGEASGRHLIPLEPVAVDDLAPVRISHELPMVACPRLRRAGKVASGTFLLDATGFAAWAVGDVPSADSVVAASEVWRVDSRLGIALDARTRTVETGRLYTSDTAAFRHGGDVESGFVVGVAGASGLVPAEGLLRLGGDGRGAAIEPAPDLEGPWRQVPAGERFRLVLATPGIFPDGWRPPGLVADGAEWWLRRDGFRARLCCAATGRGGVVSGFDVARHRPKPAERAAPAGSVYWFDRAEGDRAVLSRVLDEGLWALSDKDPPGARDRAAEGFNNAWFASWTGNRS